MKASAASARSAVVLVCLLVALGSACSGDGGAIGSAGPAEVLTDTSFLRDIVQNVAGDRLTVSSLLPEGADPHSFEPTPGDARRLADCRAVVINAEGLVPTVDALVAGSAGAGKMVIEAAAGIPGVDQDPHCWLDPLLVATYVENVALGLSELDPAGADVYRANAAAYSESLSELDAWIEAQVQTIPQDRRLLVTNHESLGRFASRYGFELVGAVFPSTSGQSSPSAKRLAELIAAIEASGAPAIFVEKGISADLALQVGTETGAKVVADLLTHSLGAEAPTYLEMMRWNVTRIVEALH